MTLECDSVFHFFIFLLTRCVVSADTKEEIQQKLIAEMHYELRTILSSLMGQTELLTHQQLSHEAMAQAAMIMELSVRMAQVLNKHQRSLREGTAASRPELVNVEKFLSDVCRPLLEQASSKRLAFQCEVDEEVPKQLWFCYKSIHSVLTRLISNAITFTVNGAVQVLVHWKKNEQQLWIEVIDTGVGLSEKRIRDMLPRDSAQIGVGTGLGRACLLLRSMGGDLELKSALGMGSTFTLRLTCAPQDDDQSRKVTTQQEVSAHEAAVATRSSMARAHVLVAEDNLTNQQVIRAMLKLIGCQFTIVDDGKKALAAVQEGGYDVVLMDMQMPEMDGLEATRQIRLLDTHKNIPIIALTANAMKGDRDRCIEAGMNDYLSKPVTRHDLVNMLSRYICS